MFKQAGLLLFLVITLLLVSCQKDKNDPAPAALSHEVATEWYHLLLTLTKETPGFTPPVAARAFGYCGIALYEGMVPGAGQATSLQGQINGLNKGSIPTASGNYDYEIVANSILAAMARKMYRNTSPANIQLIAQLETNQFNILAEKVSSDIAMQSQAYGIAVAEAVYQYSLTDMQDECFKNNFPDTYVSPVGAGLWVPTPPLFQKALQPYWGAVRPFISQNLIPVQPAGPPSYSTVPGSKFYQEGIEVYTVSQHLTAEEKVIAEFWSDDPGKTATPPGHSISIAVQMIQNENLNLWETAEILARVGMGTHDAFVSCWKSKYDFNLLRPVTYIQELFDPTWSSYLSTPPFPEYTSGHSVQTGAAAAIMSHYFGDNYAFTDRTHVQRTDINGSPREFSSFSELADEAAFSRLYGGIHFRAAILDGVEQGKQIGQNLIQLDMLN